jgi:uncharacterized protein (DUF1697 family)
MTVYISLLRGINVGGSKILSMDTLCELYVGLGFSHIRTYLQSGNVIFDSHEEDQLQLARQIESKIEQAFNFHVNVFIRQVQELQHIITGNPFLGQVQADTNKLHVSFLYTLPAETAWSKLVIPANIPDKLVRGDMVIYLYYPNGYARAKISTSHLEKLLGAPITNRNWNTVIALYKIADEIKSTGE